MNAEASDAPPHGWRGAWQLLRGTFAEWWEDNTLRMAASLAFYTIFSVAPVLLIAVGIASFFLSRETAVEQLLSQLRSLIGEEGAHAVRQVIESQAGFGRGMRAIVTGAITLFLGATVVFMELQAALNQIWDVKAEPRRGVILQYLLDRLRSFGIAIVVGFLLLVSLVLSTALAVMENYMNTWLPGVPLLWQALNVVTSMAVATVLFALIYKYLPDAVIAWRDVWIGGAVTAVLFTIGKSLIGVYLGQTAMGSAFGAAGSLAVLLIWIYYSALICFFGAEFTQVYARMYGSRIRAEAHAVRAGRKRDDELPGEADADERA